MRLWGFFFVFSFILFGCSDDPATPSPAPPFSIPDNESAYCTLNETYASPTTVTGTAEFERRAFDNSTGLGAVEAAKPIRYAEVQALNASGTLVQCTETLANGTFSLDLPQDGQTYTIKVNSRSFNNNLKASVLNDLTLQVPHSISGTVATTSAAEATGTLTASYIGTLSGGAFNILDQALVANEYLRTTSGNCSGTFAGCTDFTVAPKCKIFWDKGFNPNEYLSGSSPLSFYLTGYSALFILGGSNGDVDNSDTDHFDNSVISHEYGHFIEDIYATSDSPGGSHDANSIIDPRLAWGEGWATFFSMAVNDDPTYRDTYGNEDGSTNGNFFKQNLEDNTPTPKDVPTQPGEGNFREFSIVRALWDAIDLDATDADNDGVEADFMEFWHIFTGDFKSTLPFRDYGLFTSLHDALAGRTDISSALTAENQRLTREDYAEKDTTPGGTCTHTIQAVATGGASEDGSFAESNQFNSNDFYTYYHTGGTFTASLSYTTASNPATDLDLYVYREGYSFGNGNTVATYSDANASSGANSENTSVNLTAGNYLLNVKVYTGDTLGVATNYTLTVNGEQICP